MNAIDTIIKSRKSRAKRGLYITSVKDSKAIEIHRFGDGEHKAERLCSLWARGLNYRMPEIGEAQNILDGETVQLACECWNAALEFKRQLESIMQSDETAEEAARLDRGFEIAIERIADLQGDMAVAGVPGRRVDEQPTDEVFVKRNNGQHMTRAMYLKRVANELTKVQEDSSLSRSELVTLSRCFAADYTPNSCAAIIQQDRDDNAVEPRSESREC